MTAFDSSGVWHAAMNITTGHRVDSLPDSLDYLCKHLDPDQARQNVGPDLDPNSLIL